MVTWSRNPSADMPQLFVFFRFPPADRQVALLPIAFTGRVRRDSSLPLPILLRGRDPPFPTSPNILGSGFSLSSMTDSGTACAFPYLLCCSLHTSTRPTNKVSYNLFCTHPPSTTRFPHHMSVLDSPSLVVFLQSIAWIGSSPTLLPSTLHTRALLTISSSRSSLLVSKASSSHPHVHLHLLLKYQSCAVAAT